MHLISASARTYSLNETTRTKYIFSLRHGNGNTLTHKTSPYTKFQTLFLLTHWGRLVNMSFLLRTGVRQGLRCRFGAGGDRNPLLGLLTPKHYKNRSFTRGYRAQTTNVETTRINTADCIDARNILNPERLPVIYQQQSAREPPSSCNPSCFMLRVLKTRGMRKCSSTSTDFHWWGTPNCNPWNIPPQFPPVGLVRRPRMSNHLPDSGFPIISREGAY